MMASKQVKIVCAGLVLACALLTPFTWSHRASPKGYEKSSSDLEVTVGISPSELSKKRAIDSIRVRAGGKASALIHEEVSSKPEDGEDEEGSQTGCNRARVTFIVPKGFKYPADTEGRFEPTDHKLDGELIYLIMKPGEDGNKVTLNCNNEDMEEDLSMEASPDGYEGQCEFVCSASDDGVHQWNLLQNTCICAKKIVEHDEPHLADAEGQIGHRAQPLNRVDEFANENTAVANNASSSSEDEDEKPNSVDEFDKENTAVTNPVGGVSANNAISSSEDEDEKPETNLNSSPEDGSEDSELNKLNQDPVITNGPGENSVTEDRESPHVNATTNDVAKSSVEDNADNSGWPKAPSLPTDNGEDEEEEDEDEDED